MKIKIKDALLGLWKIFEEPKLKGRVSSSPKTNRYGRKIKTN